MKKLISIMLSFALLLTTTVTVSFAANNGPKDDSNGLFSPAFIWCIPTDNNGEYIPADNPNYQGDYKRYVIYGDGKANNSALKGATYDKGSNTLTLNALNAPTTELGFNAMGDDFTINVVGNCSLAQISPFSSTYSAAVTFSGSGTLNINAKKIFDYGIESGAYYTKGTITFGNNVKVNISGKKGAVSCSYSNATSNSEVFKFNGTSNAATKAESVYNEKYTYFEGYTIDKTPKPQYVGKIAKRASDPNGIYTMGTSTMGDEKGFWAQKYVYSKSLKAYLEYGDSLYSFAPQYDWDTNNLGENFDFTQTDEILYNTTYSSDHRWRTYEICTDSSGKQYACGECWNSDLGALESEVVTFKAISDVPGEYQFTPVYTGAQADSFISGLTHTGNEIDGGYVISPLEPNRDWLGYRVKNSADPNGIYFRTEGWKYDEEDNQIDMYFIRKYTYVEQYGAYIEDHTFGEYGSLDLTPDAFATSGYSLVLDSNGKSIGQENVGEIKNVYGYLYADSTGKKYIVETNWSDETETVYTYKTANGINILTEAKSVDPSTLTRVVEKTKVDGVKNYFITNTSFTYAGSANGHEHKYTTKVVAPTYEAQGYTLHTCSICGTEYKDNYKAKLVVPTVTGFKATATTATAIKVTCNKVAGATGYVYYRANAGKWVKIGVSKANAYTDTKLKAGTTYKYAVKAYKTVGSKNYYSAKFPTLTTTTNPATVNFKLTAGSRKVALAWSKTTGATGYIAYMKTSAKGSWSKIATTKKLAYTKTGLTKGRAYWFAVRAYKTLGGKNYLGTFATKSIKAK